MSALAALAAIVALAFLIESIVGFGSTVLTVTLGAHLVPIDDLLPRFIPLNLLLSAALLVPARDRVDRALLGRTVLPPIGLGLLAGMALYRLQSALALQLAFGLFVTLLALVELVRRLRSTDDVTPLAPLPSALLLALGGVVHGLFGSGGPLIVYVLSRKIPDRSALRASLAALWLLLNLALVVNFLTLGKLSLATLRDSALLLPSLGVGLGVGNWLHRVLPERPFRLLVYVVLLVAGGALVARTLPRLLAA